MINRELLERAIQEAYLVAQQQNKQSLPDDQQEPDKPTADEDEQ